MFVVKIIFGLTVYTRHYLKLRVTCILLRNSIRIYVIYSNSNIDVRSTARKRDERVAGASRECCRRRHKWHCVLRNLCVRSGLPDLLCELRSVPGCAYLLALRFFHIFRGFEPRFVNEAIILHSENKFPNGAIARVKIEYTRIFITFFPRKFTLLLFDSR